MAHPVAIDEVETIGHRLVNMHELFASLELAAWATVEVLER